MNKILHVVAVISNPCRFKSRYDLYWKFKAHMDANPHVRLMTVEIAFGDRPFEVTTAGDPQCLQLRTFDELWHKENMINLGVQRLPSDWEYMAWIDADVEFPNTIRKVDWALETIHQLQHHQVVQMFQQAIDTGPNGEAFQMHQGFAYSYLSGKPRAVPGKYAHWHPGFAWAMRREAWDMLGGIYDVSILGSGDHLMAWGLIGEGIDQLPSTMSQGYRKSLHEWQRKADRLIHRDIGFVPGMLIHHWHGKKADRRYRDRWKILSDANFNPETDLKRDWQGLLQLDHDGSPRLIRLRDDIRAYFRSRNEDSIDLE
jgi:hypothetical protein